MSHTPGPWKWWTSCSWRRLKHDSPGLSMNVLEPYVCKDGHPDLDVNPDDMNLIAAAPDLLEACEMARPYLRRMALFDPQAQEIFLIIIAAIAKAKGEAE